MDQLVIVLRNVVLALTCFPPLFDFEAPVAALSCRLWRPQGTAKNVDTEHRYSNSINGENKGNNGDNITQVRGDVISNPMHRSENAPRDNLPGIPRELLGSPGELPGKGMLSRDSYQH